MKQLNKILDGTHMQTQLFAVGSLEESNHANHFQPQDTNKEIGMNAIYGQKTLESFERLNQPGLFAKTFSDLLIGTEEWYSSRCVLTWRLRVTKCNRMYFLLQVSTLPTKGIGSGLLPTPVVMDSNGGDLEKIDARRENLKAKKINGNGFGQTLGELAQRGLLPTPSAQEADKASAQDHQNSLTRMLKKGELIPTPAARDYKGAHRSEAKQGGDNLETFICKTGKGSQLNPRFVLEMMGFPSTHCDSAFEKIAWELYQKKKSTKSFQKRLRIGATIL